MATATLFVLRRKRSRIYATKNTDFASRKTKELHAAHTVPKETDHLHVQEDLNSTIYAHALINLNSTHDCSIREAFTVLRECILPECLDMVIFFFSFSQFFSI